MQQGGVAPVARLIGRSDVQVQSTSLLLSDANRIRHNGSDIQTNSQLTTIGNAFKPALFDTFLAVSAVTALGKGFRPGEVNPVTVASSVSSDAKFIGRSDVQA